MRDYARMPNGRYVCRIIADGVRMSLGCALMRWGSKLLYPLMSTNTKLLNALTVQSFIEDLKVATKEIQAQTHNRFNRS
jgi:hypothetical protein